MRISGRRTSQRFEILKLRHKLKMYLEYRSNHSEMHCFNLKFKNVTLNIDINPMKMFRCISGRRGIVQHRPLSLSVYTACRGLAPNVVSGRPARSSASCSGRTAWRPGPAEGQRKLGSA